MVTAHTEFAANVYTRTDSRCLGVALRSVPVRVNRILVEDLTHMVDDQTRLVALSFVKFYTGFCDSLADIGAYCGQYGIYLAVDAMQGLGSLCSDASSANADYFSASAYKWLLGAKRPVSSGAEQEYW